MIRLSLLAVSVSLLALGAATAQQTDAQIDAWDTDANAELTLSEFRAGFEATGIFNEWDADNDRVLTEAEFDATDDFVARFGEDVYAQWDANDDDSLTEDEFYEGVYASYDLDNSQVLTAAEYDALPADFGVTDQQITGAIGTADQAGDAFEAEIVPLPSWQAQQLYAGGFSVEQLVGADVYIAGDALDRGDVENVIFDNDGNVLSVVAEIGGLFELGDTHVNVPWDEVQYDPAADRITVPITADNVAQYSVFADPILSSFEAAGDIAEVTGDGPGEVGLGPRAFRATDFLQDYARLIDEGNWVNYGFVDDLIVRDGKIAAVIVRPDVTYGAPGPYAYPYYGYPYGWTPASPYYDLPYQRGDIDRLEPMDTAGVQY